MFANAVRSTKIHKAFSSFRGLAVRKGGAKVDSIKRPKDFTAFRADKHCRFEVTNLESSPEATCLLDGKVEVEHCIAGSDQGILSPQAIQTILKRLAKHDEAILQLQNSKKKISNFRKDLFLSDLNQWLKITVIERALGDDELLNKLVDVEPGETLLDRRIPGIVSFCLGGVQALPGSLYRHRYIIEHNFYEAAKYIQAKHSFSLKKVFTQIYARNNQFHAQCAPTNLRWMAENMAAFFAHVEEEIYLADVPEEEREETEIKLAVLRTHLKRLK